MIRLIPSERPFAWAPLVTIGLLSLLVLMFAQVRSTLPLALCAYMVAITLMITLAPFDFRTPDSLQLSWTVNHMDVLANLIFFVPLGFLFGLSLRSAALVLLTCALVSLTVEVAQLWVPIATAARSIWPPTPSGRPSG